MLYLTDSDSLELNMAISAVQNAVKQVAILLECITMWECKLSCIVVAYKIYYVCVYIDVTNKIKWHEWHLILEGVLSYLMAFI